MPPTTPDDISTLERLRRKLYASDAPPSFPTPTLSPSATQAAADEGWAPAPPPSPKKSRVSWAAMFLGVAALFFVIAVSTAAYFLIVGGRAVSTDRIVITPDGPTTTGSGDTITLLISIENKNPVPALSTALTVAFPDTARMPENPEQPLLSYEDTVGDILAGETGTRSVRAVLFGSEGERIQIPIRFEYRVDGSNAVYVKEAMYEVVITSSPLSVRAEAVSEVSVGQTLTFAVTVRSNAKETLENVAVLAQYPFGFTPRRGEGPVFPVGTLAPGEERTITVTGTLTGEDNDERFFRFTGGIQRGTDTNVLAISYSTAEAPVQLRKPFLATTLSLNRDTGPNPVAVPGEPVQGVVSWVNTLSTPILDGQVSVKLSGAAFDPATVSTYGGFYRSSDTTIVFSRETESGLANLAPGASGSGTFNFRIKPAGSLAGQQSPTVTATISVAGRRVGESNVPETVSSSVVRTLRVGTNLALSANALYSTGAFTNTGPWPPVADQETTYTVALSVGSAVSASKDTVVTGTLPSYVRYIGATDNSVSYNTATRVVTWRAGEIAKGGNRSASFQVALLPSVSQRGTSPVLLSSVSATGYDSFAQTQLTASVSPVTTQTLSDPAYVQGRGEVR